MRQPRSGADSRRAPAPPPSAIVAVALLLAASSGCGGGETPQAAAAGAEPASRPGEATDESPEDAIAVELGPVSRRSLASLYSTSATLRADKLATITARTRGVIRELHAEEGDWVDSGQSLARLESDEQRIAHEQAGAVADATRRELERAEALHAQGLIADEAYEQIRREATETGHTAALAELTLSRTVIRAPFSGRIITRHVDPGGTVSDGTAMFDIADLDPLYADVQVPERQVARLGAGQTVRIVADHAGATDEHVARIERIAPAVDPETGTVKVTIAVPRTPALRPGSFVRVGIVTDTHENALVVPRSALVAEGRRWHLFRVSDDDPDKVELVEVTRGYEEADLVEIVGAEAERPLVEGDRVVVTGAPSLSDGSVIEVLGPEAGRSQRDSAEADEDADTDAAAGGDGVAA